jgi:hypothetical protein
LETPGIVSLTLLIKPRAGWRLTESLKLAQLFRPLQARSATPLPDGVSARRDLGLAQMVP